MIGRGCKDRKVLSLPVLIGRGLEGTASGVAVWSLHRGSESQAKVPVAFGNRDPNARAMAKCRGLYRLLGRFPVALPEGPHPFPFRTRSLSPPGPMVLCGQLRGRVGRCWDYFRRSESSWTPPPASSFWISRCVCMPARRLTALKPIPKPTSHANL